jgi:hypothetical protein
VNRTEGNPVEVFLILHDTTTPLPVVPQYGADAAKLYPDLFPTAAPARQAFRRAHLDVERAMISPL